MPPMRRPPLAGANQSDDVITVRVPNVVSPELLFRRPSTPGSWVVTSMSNGA